MKIVRTTSRYTLTAKVDQPGAALDLMVEHLAGRPFAEQSRAFHDGKELTLTFRIYTSDTAATALATELLALVPNVRSAGLHTGVGVNRRLVARQ